MKKNGFTLIELIAAIAIIAVITLMVVPNVISIFNKSKRSILDTQISNIKDASLLYVNDFCKYPLNGNGCPVSYDTGRFICLSEIQSPTSTTNSTGYIGTISYSGNECKGVSVISEVSGITSSSVYLKCGSEYFPEGTTSTTVSPYSTCFN